MDFNLTPTKLIDQLRAWFHPKDRSVFIAEDCFIDMDEQATPTTPASGRRRLYPKDAGWYELDDAGTESPLGGSLIVHDHSTALLGGQNLRSIQELEFDNYSKLTVNAGVVTRTQVYHSIDTEAAAATDDLDTINGGTEADLLITRQDNDARDIKYTLAGNLEIPSGIDLYSDLASQAFGWIFDGQNWLNFANPFGRWSLISETILGASAGSISFATIPQTYRTLVFVLSLRTDRVAEVDIPVIQFNGDTGNNYDYAYISANDTTVSSDGVRGAANIWAGLCEAASSTASAFSSIVIFIPSYADTNMFKTVIVPPSGVFGNVSADTDAFIRVNYGKWRSTAAITSVTIDQNTGPNYVQFSRAALYGIL